MFHTRYMMIIYAVNPPTDIPHSLTGRNTKNMHTSSAMPPQNIYGLRLPHFPRVLSLRNPINGSVKASHSFAIIIMVDATVIAMPFLVMYASMTQDIILTPPPSIRPPMP